MKKIDSVGIILTYKCSSRCRHCLYACSPDWKDFMSKEIVESILVSLKNIWKNYRPDPFKNILFHGIHFAGGEPFLNFPLLHEAVKTASKLGLYANYVETNASWCVNEDDVREKFSLLKKAGLKRIFISCSPFHSERIPLERTLLAIRVGWEVFGKENTIVYMEHFVDLISKISTKETIPIERWIDLFGERNTGYIFWRGYSIIPGGRSGFELGYLWRRYPAVHFRRENCYFEILESQHAHIDPYGNYVPYFCGGISLGDARNLERFYEKFSLDNLPLVKILVSEGPYGLMKFAEKYGFKEPPGGYTGKCHLCVDARRFLHSMGDFPELNPKGFYENL